MLALSQDLSQNRPAEAREHVRRFHELFFTLSPEKTLRQTGKMPDSPMKRGESSPTFWQRASWTTFPPVH